MQRRKDCDEKNFITTLYSGDSKTIEFKLFNSEDYGLKLKWFEFLSVNLPVACLKLCNLKT